MNWLLDAKIAVPEANLLGLHLSETEILWREIIGNVIGLASAVLGMYRRVGAWPIGMIANAILFTVFLGGVFHTPQDKDLWGQAGRQVFFFAVSAYGWWRWHRNRGIEQVAVTPRWATGRERLIMGLFAVVGLGLGYVILKALGSWGPLADAWIFVGSILATYGMAKGYVDFWLCWVAVDIVGVPLLLNAGYYPSALLYIVYGAFCLWGFFTWLSVKRNAARVNEPTLEAVG